MLFPPKKPVSKLRLKKFKYPNCSHLEVRKKLKVPKLFLPSHEVHYCNMHVVPLFWLLPYLAISRWEHCSDTLFFLVLRNFAWEQVKNNPVQLLKINLLISWYVCSLTKSTHLKPPSLHLRKTRLLKIQFVFPGAKDSSIQHSILPK